MQVPLMSRRLFLKTFAAFSSATILRGTAATADQPARGKRRILFTSQGKTAIVNADGSGLRYFDFDKPGQATWQPCGAFKDGQHPLSEHGAKA